MSNPRLFMQRLVFIIATVFLNAQISLAEPNPSAPQMIVQPVSAPPVITRPNVAQINYEELRDNLATYQNALTHPWPTVPDDKTLKFGSHGDAVVILRDRLIASEDFPAYYTNRDSRIFDLPLAEAVKHFQARHGLRPDGIAGLTTLRELNVPASDRVRQIELNMQRWASLGPQLTNRFVMVNVPDYRLNLYENNKIVLTMKAIVGKPTLQTPEITSTIKRIVLNPYWNIPDSIAKNDIAPKVQQDPNYLNDMHIRIFDKQDEDATEITQDEIDWQSAATDGLMYHLRQDPGNDNALGLIKFEFNNSQDVYLHDTPAKNLFALDQRSLSHGCVRLEKPYDLVANLMENDPEWDELKMQAILDTGKTTYVKTARPTPIFITYITAWVDENGALNFRNDVYARDGLSTSPYIDQTTEDGQASSQPDQSQRFVPSPIEPQAQPQNEYYEYRYDPSDPSR